MSTAISICTIILLLVLSASIVTVTVFLVKWIIEFTLLTRNINETTTIVKKEIEPILGEVKETMVYVNSIAKNADNQLSTLKKIISTIIGFFTMFAGKFKFLQSSFFKGLFASFNLFRKK